MSAKRFIPFEDVATLLNGTQKETAPPANKKQKPISATETAVDSWSNQKEDKQQMPPPPPPPLVRSTTTPSRYSNHSRDASPRTWSSSMSLPCARGRNSSRAFIPRETSAEGKDG